ASVSAWQILRAAGYRWGAWPSGRIPPTGQTPKSRTDARSLRYPSARAQTRAGFRARLLHRALLPNRGGLRRGSGTGFSRTRWAAFETFLIPLPFLSAEDSRSLKRLLKSLQLPAAAKAATDFAAVTARLEAAPFQNAISNAIENAILKRDRNSSFSAACIDKHILAKRIFILLTNP